MGFHPSIRGLSIAVSLSLVLAAGLLTGILAITTANHALDQTKDTSDRGLRACFAGGEANAVLLGSQMMDRAVKEISARLAFYLYVPVTHVKQMHGRMKPEPPWVAKDYVWMNETVKPLIFSTMQSVAEAGVTEVSIYVDGTDVKNVTGGTAMQKPITLYKKPGYSDPLADNYLAEMNSIPRGVGKGLTEGQAGGYLLCTEHPDSIHNPDKYKHLPYGRAFLCVDKDNQLQPEGLAGLGTNMAIGTPDEYGRIINLPGHDGRMYSCDPEGVMVTNRPTGRCPIPKMLASETLPMLRGLTEEGRVNTVRWSPIENKGPLLSLVTYTNWDHALQPEDPVGAQGKVIGFIQAGIDLTKMSSFFADTVATLPTGSRAYGVLHDPWYRVDGCIDDPHGVVQILRRSAGGMTITCSMLTNMFTCDGNINQLVRPGATGPTDDDDPNAKRDALPWELCYVWQNCPVMCGRCPSGNDDPSVVGDLVGVSHGKAYFSLPLEDSFYGDIGIADRRKRHITEASDPVILANGNDVLRRTEASFPPHGTWSSYDAGLNMWTGPHYQLADDPSGRPRESSETADYWMMVHPQSDEYGMLIYVTMLVPQAEALKDIDEATRATKLQIDQENSKTEKDKEDAFNTMIAIVVVCIAVLMAGSVAYTETITRPLRALRDKMQKVAMMDLDIDTHKASMSRLAELRHMERSFARMVSNLKEYRNYMPASLLIDDAAYEDDEAAPEKDDAAGTQVSAAASRSQASQSRASKRSAAVSQKSAIGPQSSMQSSKSAAMRAFMQKQCGGGVKKKKASLCVMNAVDFHGGCQRETDPSLDTGHGTVILTYLEAAQVAKGITDTFSGDRLPVSFNAVRPLGTHRVGAVNLASIVRGKFEELSLWAWKADVSIACVTGDARCGNMGCAGMKKFSFIGALVTSAYAIERWNRHMKMTSLTDSGIYEDAKNSFYFRTADRIAFPKRQLKPIGLFELRQKKAVGEDEWMYQLEEGAKNDPYNFFNTAMKHMFDGDHAAAEQALKEHLTAHPAGPTLNDKLVERLQSLIDAKQPYEPVVLLYH